MSKRRRGRATRRHKDDVRSIEGFATARPGAVIEEQRQQVVELHERVLVLNKPPTVQQQRFMRRFICETFK